MRKHGLTENGGTTSGGETLRNLTTKGLEAASYELGRPVTEMGSTARGAGASGATHPMAVNETIIAMLRPKPNLARMTEDPAEVRAAAQAAIDAPGGIGTIAQYWTEVPLPATGTWSTPGKGGAQADIVLTAPQDQGPLLFIEADNCHETAEELADKLEKYARFFRRKTKDTDGKERPMWRTRWTVPEGRPADVPHPPVLLVFNRLGDRNPNRTIPRLTELTATCGQGSGSRTTTSTTGRSPSSRPGCATCASTARTARCSSASAATTCSPCAKRSATPAARRPTHADEPSNRPTNARTRSSCAVRPSSRRPSGKRAVRHAPAAARSSPTTGGRRPRHTRRRDRGGIRRCATDARARP
ncbi:replication-relaxation family protein [Streptomyces sp. NPDC102437]|uniref:replication-relaxation family protein n=1 Tax=Streptomyces sp. NPDC102437 TaxID=3366175 RepID=UPI00380A827C